MAIEYTWKINNVWKEQKGSTEPTNLGTDSENESVDVELTDFIQSVNLTITGTEGDISCKYETNANLYHNPDNSYTSYADVTTAKLLEWSKAALTQPVIDNIKAQLEREINEKKNTNLATWNN